MKAGSMRRIPAKVEVGLMKNNNATIVGCSRDLEIRKVGDRLL